MSLQITRRRAAADVIIVGAGLSGLSCALHLSQIAPRLTISIVEAGVVGAGASGKSTGMIGPGVIGPIDGLQARYGDALARAIFRSSERAVQHVIATVRQHDLACNLEINQQLKLADSPQREQGLRRQGRVFTDLGLDVPVLGQRELSTRLGTRRWRAGLRYRAANLDPLALCRELARVVRSRGVTIHEGAAVARLRRDSGRLRAVLGDGSERVADRIVVATNAFASRLGVHAGKVLPIHTHVVLTEPLSADQRSTLAWTSGRESLVGGRQCFSYGRLTADHRVLWGGGAPLYRMDWRALRCGALDACSNREFSRLAAELRSTFPALSGIPIARRWSGCVGFTLDNIPMVGPIDRAHNDLVFMGAWCGHGLAMAAATGAEVARFLVDGTRPQLPWWRSSAPWLPPDPLRRIGLTAYIGSMRLKDRTQNHRAQPATSPAALSLAGKTWAAPTRKPLQPRNE